MERAAEDIDGSHVGDAARVSELARLVDISDAAYPDRFGPLVKDGGLLPVREGVCVLVEGCLGRDGLGEAVSSAPPLPPSLPLTQTTHTHTHTTHTSRCRHDVVADR